MSGEEVNMADKPGEKSDMLSSHIYYSWDYTLREEQVSGWWVVRSSEEGKMRRTEWLGIFGNNTEGF